MMHVFSWSRIRLLCFVAYLLLGAPVLAQEKEIPAALQINQALSAAQYEQKHVLLLFSAPWCLWCRVLTGLMQGNSGLKDELTRNYKTVIVELGAKGRPQNRDVADYYGNPQDEVGIPLLIVLNLKGQVLRVRETSVFGSVGTRGYDPQKILTFLRQYAAS